MIRQFVKTILTRLTTDVAALRAENDRLTQERERCEANLNTMRQLHALSVDERDRLRAIAGNTDATPNEALMLDLVRGTPGLLAREYGAMFAKVDPTYPTDDPNQWIIGNNAKHLSALHRKGLVRREQAGQTYRYWVADA